MIFDIFFGRYDGAQKQKAAGRGLSKGVKPLPSLVIGKGMPVVQANQPAN